MTSRFPIDTRFDLRAEAGGRDPDKFSKTLRVYHQVLWSKPLPDGTVFALDDTLRHTSNAGTFRLSSDTIVPTHVRWSRPARLVGVIQQVPAKEVSDFVQLACTVGAFLIFPLGSRVDGKGPQSINQARGINPRIGDRFDLTLECIRRHYEGSPSPLGDVLARHGDFFDLFGRFSAYVDHFLLNDLISQDGDAVKFLTPFDDFARDPLPATTVAHYRAYMGRSMDFVRARNERILAYAESAL